MLFFVIAIIALGWAAFGFSWTRDRRNEKSRYGLPPSPYITQSGPLAPPRTAAMAQARRQQVLAALIVAAVATYFLTRLWSFMWGLHILVDVALLAFAVALYMRSLNPQVFNQPVSAGFTTRLDRSDRPERHNRGVEIDEPANAGWVKSSGYAGTSVLSAAPRPPVTGVVDSGEQSLIDIPERRFASLGSAGRFAPVLEDERTAVRPGPAR